MVSALLVGMSLHSRLKKRRDFLHEMLVFISLIKIEFEFMSLTVLQVLRKIQSTGSCRNLDFINDCIKSINAGDDFSSAWHNAVSLSRLPMKKEEREKLADFGNLVGTSDIKGQLSLLSLFYESFLAYGKKADEDFEKYGKLCITVSIIVGTGIFIFII